MRTLLLLSAAALALGLVPAALADPPTKVVDEFSASETIPAGGVCDFDYRIAFTARDIAIEFTDGRAIVHSEFEITHSNLDTGYALTEKGIVNLHFSADGQEKDAGLYWHLRDPSGKLVVVHAGQIVFDDSGNVITFTPNTDPPGFAEVICPALGGAPA